MQVYLPIAEMSVDVFLILGLGGGVGMLSGLFGVGGGFLMTPLLIFIGVPPAVAVGSEAAQITASSVSGVPKSSRLALTSASTAFSAFAWFNLASPSSSFPSRMS